MEWDTDYGDWGLGMTRHAFLSKHLLPDGKKEPKPEDTGLKRRQWGGCRLADISTAEHQDWLNVWKWT